MTKPKRKILFEPMFSFGWAIQIGGTDESFFKWVAKKGLNVADSSPTRLACFTYAEQREKRCAIWLSKLNYGLLVHEVVHAVVHVAAVCHLSSADNNEFMPSYAEWLTSEIIKVGKK